MLILLLPLACVPLLGLEPLRWHHRHGNHAVLRKAFWLAFSSSVTWSLLSDYVSTTYAGWSWLFYVLLAAGAAFTGVCARKHFARKHFGESHHRRRTALAVFAYLAVFNMAARLIPASTWTELRENVASMGSLSRLRGPLR